MVSDTTPRRVFRYDADRRRRSCGGFTLGSGIVPEYFTAIIFFFLAMVLTDAAAPMVFSGFHSAAVWMIFGGLTIGAAVQETGFGRTLASWLLKIFPSSYFGILCGITAVHSPCFIIPSNTGRIVIMIPIFAALADEIGFGPGSHGCIGMGLAVAAGSVYPSLVVLPAESNLGWLGATEYSRHNLHIRRISNRQLSGYGTVSIIAIPLLCRTLFADEMKKIRQSCVPSNLCRTDTFNDGASRCTRSLANGFCTRCVAGMVALGAALICMPPRVALSLHQS